ncbi:MAG TPA: nucleoside transporter C-terminal domain-containing protein [Candidatus Acidoferrales bacterium]|nr:nucleoside transporter C-terminal domain-containing protein [Candidatus Acidoferrales bacterium]
MERFIGILGLAILLGGCWLFSTNRKAIRWRTVGIGVFLQVVFAILVTRVAAGQKAIAAAGNGAKWLLDCSFAGSEFLFGAAGAKHSSLGFMFAFQVLPAIIFIAAFFAILYYFGVMQFIIRMVAWVMEKAMGASGAESLNVAASIVMGQTEAPLTIRPYLPRVTQSELMVIMTAGMAHVSGSIMAAYLATGVEAKHILAAVIMTAPGTLTVAKMLVPETEVPETAGGAKLPEDGDRASNVLEAAAKGTSDGLHLALNVGAMLISFLAIIFLINASLGAIHHGLSLQKIFGFAFAPVAFIIGVPWRDCISVGGLLGTRMVMNELVAFTNLGGIKAALDPRSYTIATFALCGFANFSSIGIQIGGLGALAPNRRADLARLGFKAMLAGTVANLMSACIVGVLL